uniref:Uncharacterized protein n=2 Tax=Oryza sativa subsp. japonica TaxID=39947 RepID=Q10IU2_ORYSJ|nr:hypothetical protein [Oryza sativa Japonica Group]ABF96897.1 transposon protein, putative, unclassified [Oryza sativa Japonica Group]
MGPACKELHVYYMEKSNARRKNRETSMLGQHDGQPFLRPTAFIAVDFKDLWDLHRVRAIDTNLLKCYSLLTWKHVHRKAPHVALLDPAVVNETTLKNDRANMMGYIKDCLFARQDKDFIMCAYNQHDLCPLTGALPDSDEAFSPLEISDPVIVIVLDSSHSIVINPVTTGINPTGVSYVRVLFLVPGGKGEQGNNNNNNNKVITKTEPQTKPYPLDMWKYGSALQQRPELNPYSGRGATSHN